MNNDPVLLAKKITSFILNASEPVSLITIEERAKSHDIPFGILDNAMAIVNRNRHLERKVKGDDIFYGTKKVKEKAVRVRECLVEVKGLTVLPTGEFMKPNDVLYAKGRVLTPKSEIDFIWFSPTDIGLDNDNLPLPEQATPELIPFESLPEQPAIFNPYKRKFYARS